MSDARPANSGTRAPVWIWWLVGAGVLFFVVPIVAIVAISIFGTKVGGMFGTSAAVLPGAHSVDAGEFESGHLVPTDDGPIAVGRLTPTPNVDGVEVLFEPPEESYGTDSGELPLVRAFHAFARAHAGAAPRTLDELLGVRDADGVVWIGDASELQDLGGTPYEYSRRETSAGWSVSLKTLGRDRRAGGEALDADLVVLDLVLPRE